MNILFYLILWPTFGSFGLLKLIFTFIIGSIPIYLKFKSNNYKFDKIFIFLSTLILITTFLSYSISIILGNGPNGFTLKNYLLDISRFLLITFIPLIVFDITKKSKPSLNNNISFYTNYQIQGVLIILSIQFLQLITSIFRIPYSEVIIFSRYTGPFSYLDEGSLFTFLVFIGIAFNNQIQKKIKKLSFLLFLFLPICLLSTSKASLILLLTAGFIFLILLIRNTKISRLYLKKFKFKINIGNLIKACFLSILVIIGLPKLSAPLLWITSGFSALSIFISQLFNINFNYSFTPTVTSNIESFSSRINEIDLCFNNSFIDYFIPYLPFGSVTFSGLPSRVSISIFDLICTYGSIPTLLIAINLTIILTFYLFEKLTFKNFMISFLFTIFLGSFTSLIKSFKIIILLSFMAGEKLLLNNRNNKF